MKFLVYGEPGLLSTVTGMIVAENKEESLRILANHLGGVVVEDKKDVLSSKHVLADRKRHYTFYGKNFFILSLS